MLTFIKHFNNNFEGFGLISLCSSVQTMTDLEGVSVKARLKLNAGNFHTRELYICIPDKRLSCSLESVWKASWGFYSLQLWGSAEVCSVLWNTSETLTKALCYGGNKHIISRQSHYRNSDCHFGKRKSGKTTLV